MRVTACKGLASGGMCAWSLRASPDGCVSRSLLFYLLIHTLRQPARSVTPAKYLPAMLLLFVNRSLWCALCRDYAAGVDAPRQPRVSAGCAAS